MLLSTSFANLPYSLRDSNDKMPPTAKAVGGLPCGHDLIFFLCLGYFYLDVAVPQACDNVRKHINTLLPSFVDRNVFEDYVKSYLEVIVK